MSGGNQQGEPTTQLFLALAVVGGFLWFVWHETHVFWEDNVFRWLRFGELWVINLFMHHRYDACLQWLHHAPATRIDAPPKLVEVTNACFSPSYLASLPNDEMDQYYYMSMPPLMMLGAITTYYLKWPIMAVMGWFAYYILFKSPRNGFKVQHTLESLIGVQSKMWPTLAPIVKYNPSKHGRLLGDPIPDQLPPFAEALSPEEWLSWNRIPLTNNIPDRDAARRAFTRQLGPRWGGVDSLAPYMQALVAAFALRGAQKRDESEALLGRISHAWSPDKGFVMESSLASEVAKVLKDPNTGGKALAVADQYAWRTTAMLGVLKWARANGGVLAPAQFVWLRAQDRALWYPLNNLGRRSYHSEGAGALAHFMAEEAAHKPLPIPRIETAIVTLNTYLHDPEKKPIPIPPRVGDKAKA